MILKFMVRANLWQIKKINVKRLGDHRICMSSFVLASLTESAAAKIKNFETVKHFFTIFFENNETIRCKV